MVMSIVTTNPARIIIQLLDQPVLTQDQIFKLAHYIDAYEIEKQLQETLVIDINEITRDGIVELVLTPKMGLKYDDIAEHLKKVISYALKNVDLGECKWDIVKISFETQRPGKASYVFDDLHRAFKAD